MRPVENALKTFSALLAMALLAACGGGGSSSSPAGTTAVVRQGAVEQFGSIFINGVEIKTAGAKLHLPDDSAQPIELQNELEIRNHLKVGMVVTVKDLVDDNGLHHAAEIEFRDNLQGVVDDKGTDFITVMGQNIAVDDKGLLSGIDIGDRVEVSGMPDDKGMLHASHLRVDSSPEMEAKGFVSNLSASGFTLLLSSNATSGIAVTLGSGVTLPAGLKNGDFVEVKSTAGGSPLVASKVELEDGIIKAAENEEMEIEGFISDLSSLASLNRFSIGSGQVIEVRSSTRFVGGTRDDLALGLKVEAEGPTVGGVLMAEKISFKDNLRINGNATAVDTTAKTISILGLTVNYSSATSFKDGGSSVDPATLVGKNIEIRGLSSASGITARRVDLKNNAPANDAFIRGPVSAATPNSSITIAGLAINTSQALFKGVSDSPLTGDAFFAALNLNVSVAKVRWNPFTSTSAPATEVELEN